MGLKYKRSRKSRAENDELVGQEFCKSSYELGYERLSDRAYSIGKKISEGFGKALSEIFKGGSELKRAYEFSPMSKQNLARS
jgi:hypothetical protein